MVVSRRRPTGTPKKKWWQCVQHDVELLGVNEDLTHDKWEW